MNQIYDLFLQEATRAIVSCIIGKVLEICIIQLKKYLRRG